MFEEVGKFPDFWTMVCEDFPFFVFVFIQFLVDFLLRLHFQIRHNILHFPQKYVINNYCNFNLTIFS